MQPLGRVSGEEAKEQWGPPLILDFQKGREGGSTVVLASLSCCTHGCRQEDCDACSPPPTAPFPGFPAALLGKGLGEVGVCLPSVLAHVPTRLCNQSIAGFQCDIWSTPLSEWICTALYAMLVLVKNTQTQRTSCFLKTNKTVISNNE